MTRNHRLTTEFSLAVFGSLLLLVGLAGRIDTPFFERFSTIGIYVMLAVVAAGLIGYALLVGVVLLMRSHAIPGSFDMLKQMEAQTNALGQARKLMTGLVERVETRSSTPARQHPTRGRRKSAKTGNPKSRSYKSSAAYSESEHQQPQTGSVKRKSDGS